MNVIHILVYVRMIYEVAVVFSLRPEVQTEFSRSIKSHLKSHEF